MQIPDVGKTLKEPGGATGGSLTTYPGSGQELPVTNGQSPVLEFTRAFWTTAAFVTAWQVASFVMFVAIDSGSAESASGFYFSELMGAVWYLAYLLYVASDIRDQGLTLAKLTGISWARLSSAAGEIGKYFAGCGAFVLCSHFLLPGDELGLIGLEPLQVMVAFIMTVLVAPICEEVTFRAYLYTAMVPVFKRERERLVVNAMLFSSAHVFFFMFVVGGIPYYIVVLGYLLARLYQKHNSILPCIVLHALNNMLVFGLELFLPASSFSLLVRP